MKAHAVLLICCVDLPAQAKLLNMKQYNGKFCFPACEDEGVPRPGAHMQRNWPFNLSCNLRTHSSVKCNAREAVRVRKPVSHTSYLCACRCYSCLYWKVVVIFPPDFAHICMIYFVIVPNNWPSVHAHGNCSASVCMSITALVVTYLHCRKQTYL